MHGRLEVTDSPSGVRVLTLCNPSRKNALDAGVLEALRAALMAPPSVRALLIRGAGQGIFSAGYDLNELAAYRSGDPLPDDLVADVLDGLSGHALPSIALVTGPAFGAACELAMACDVRVGDAAARFCMPPVKLGLVYTRRGFERVASRVGVSAARFLFLTGRTVEAERALQLGLLDVLEPQAETMAFALAADLAAASPTAIRGTKAGLALVGRPAASADEVAEYERLRVASYSSEETRALVAAAAGQRK